MKAKKLDELQYLKRGNIFKHCFFATIGLLTLCILMLEFDIAFFSQRNTLTLIILSAVSLFCIEMICNDIYPLSEKRQRIIYILAGILGVAAIIISTWELIAGEAGFIEDDIVSDAGAGIIMGCLSLLILLTYVIKSSYDKTKRGEQ